MSGASLALTVALCPSVVEAQSSPPTDSSVVHAARRALSEGRPFLASVSWLRSSAPSLPDSNTVLLGARAAAGWEAWGSVVRLLDGMVWLDRMEDGEGPLVAGPGKGRTQRDAVLDAHAAVATAPPGALGRRLVTLARAFDRAGVLDSAAATYLRAASQLPEIGDWLLLRAAGVEKDSSARGVLYQQIRLATALPACAGLKPPP